MVPPEIARRVACSAGLDIPYVKRHRVHFRDFFERTISQAERQNKVESFYKALEEGNFRRDILYFFNAKEFLALQNYLEEKYDVTQVSSIEVGNERWFLYKLKNI